MISVLALAAALQGPPAPVSPEDQMLELLKRQQQTERRIEILRGTLGDAAWLTAGGAVDWYGTEYVFHTRPGEFAEGNGTGFNTGARIAGKTLMILGVTWLCKELREDGHDKAAKLLSRIGGGAWGLAGTTNILRARFDK